jgi:parallel beta-helix repeat protein
MHEGVMAEGIYHHNSHDWTYKNNIFAHSGAWGLCISDGISNINVFNNTFYDLKYYGAGFGGSYTTNVTVKNNLFIKCYDQAIIVNNGASAITEDYNLVYQSGGSLSGAHDKTGIDPQFADTAYYSGFRLKSTSPAVNAGVALTGLVNTDRVGTSRPQGGGWDMGAYEYIVTGIGRMKAESRNNDQDVFLPNPVSLPQLAHLVQTSKN